MLKKTKKIENVESTKPNVACPDCGNFGDNHELCCPNNKKTLTEWLDSYEPAELPKIEGVEIKKTDTEELKNKIELTPEQEDKIKKSMDNMKITINMSNEELANYLVNYVQPFLQIGSMELSVLDELLFRILNPDIKPQKCKPELN